MKLTGRIYVIEREHPDGTWDIEHWWNIETTRKGGMELLRVVRARARERGHKVRHRLAMYRREEAEDA